jgi:hypothetical protein
MMPLLQPPHGGPVLVEGPTGVGVDERLQVVGQAEGQPLPVLGGLGQQPFRGVEGAGVSPPSVRQGLQGRISEPETLRIDGDPPGPAQVPPRDPGGHPGSPLVDALPRQGLHHERLRQGMEGHRLAPGPDGLRDLVRPGRGQEDDGVGRRLFQRLEQDVRGLLGHPVGLIQPEHLPSRLGRGQVRA